MSSAFTKVPRNNVVTPKVEAARQLTSAQPKNLKTFSVRSNISFEPTHRWMSHAPMSACMQEPTPIFDAIRKATKGGVLSSAKNHALTKKAPIQMPGQI